VPSAARAGTNATLPKSQGFHRAVTEMGLMILGEFHSSPAEKFKRKFRRARTYQDRLSFRCLALRRDATLCARRRRLRASVFPHAEVSKANSFKALTQ
jgi:hypothetical protein